MDPLHIKQCTKAVANAAPHLKRTPAPDHLLILDGLKEHLLLVFEYLHGLERAEYAVGLWRYGLQRGLYRECLHMLATSRAMSRQYPNAVRTEACFAIGVLNERLSNLTQSLYYLNMALEAAQTFKQNDEIAVILLYISQTHRMIGDLPAALEKAQACIDVACKNNDTWALGGAYNEVGIISLFQSAFVKADKYFEKSLKIWKAAGQDRCGLEIMINRAFIAGELGEYDIAERFHRKSFSVCRRLNDPRLFTMCTHNLGDIYIYTGKIKEARKHLAASLEQTLEIGHLYLIPFTIRSMGMVFFKESNFKQAVRFFGLADHCETQNGKVSTDQEQSESNKALKVIRQRLRANIVSLCWNQGKKLSVQQALTTFSSPIKE